MSLIALDKYGEILSTNFDFVELQWSRKYRECGQFCLYMAAKDYPASMKYLQVDGRPETGIVQKVSYAKQPDGDFVTLEGFFLEKLADGGAYVFAVDMGFGGNARNSIESYLSWTLGKPHVTTDSQYNVYSWSINSASTFPSSLTANVEQGTPAGKALYNVLSTDNRSYYCKPIFNPDKSTRD